MFNPYARSVLVLAVLAVAGQAGEHTSDSVAIVKAALAAGKAALIDVREQGEWDKGHLRDAKLVPLSRLKKEPAAKELQALLPKDRPIYIHCAAGVRCLTAAEILRQDGYDVRALKDGYKDLLKAGLPKAGD